MLPTVDESIKWSTPAYSTGTILVTFAGFTRHLNLYFTPSTIEAFGAELAAHTTGKSSIRFPYEEPLPERLITDLLDFRRAEYDERGVGWM